MRIDSMRWAVRFVGLVLPLTWTGSALGQTPGANAQSYGVAVTTATVNQKTPSAVLPAEGTMAVDRAGAVTVAGLVTVQDVFAIVTGDPADGGDAVSSATLGSVSVLNGLITADGVVAMASSTGGDSNAEGSSLANLVVYGVQIAEPAPNTRVNLPGVGYVVLNEQLATAEGITVNMMHVVLQQQVLGVSRTTGNIIVGSASSGVN